MTKEELKNHLDTLLETTVTIFKKCTIAFNSDPDQGQNLKVKLKEDGVQGKVEIHKSAGQKAKVQFEIGAHTDSSQKEKPIEKNNS